LADLLRRFEGVFLNTPLAALKFHEVFYRFAVILHGAEYPAVDGLLYHCSVETSGDSVGLRTSEGDRHF
jgi:hypothetical protein